MTFTDYVDAFSWVNTKYVDNAIKSEIVNGRTIYSTGKLQTVSFVGVLKYQTTSDEPSNYTLYVGMSKQHPTDIALNLELGEEVAMMNALNNPIITMKVHKRFDEVDFLKLIKSYYRQVVHKNLKFIKTKQELDIANVDLLDII